MQTRRALRLTGWVCVVAGVLVVAWLGWSLLGTNLVASQAQDDLLDRWQREVSDVGEPGEPGEPVPPAPSTPLPPTPRDAADRVPSSAPGSVPRAVEEDGGGTGASVTTPALAQQETQPLTVLGDVGRDDPAMAGMLAEAERPGEPFALLRFRRPGASEPPVSADPYVVVDGVTADTLRTGPGHYPGTAEPGGQGNVAIAGHRTTYGAPFFHLDALREGDELLLTARTGRTFVYRVRAQQVVAPTRTDVLGPDPLGSGAPQLTLTTCHPRFSAAQRLVVHAELTGSSGPN